MNKLADGSLLSDAQSTLLNESAFFGDIIGELAKTLQEVVGLADAEGYITTVGGTLGTRISDLYNAGGPTDARSIGAILVDLKDRIGGEFKVTQVTDEKIVLTNTRCPFADRVVGKESLCMMTTNVFGQIASDRNGYAHVDIQKAIARGDKTCQVVVSLNSDADHSDTGYEFFGR